MGEFKGVLHLVDAGLRSVAAEFRDRKWVWRELTVKKVVCCYSCCADLEGFSRYSRRPGGRTYCDKSVAEADHGSLAHIPKDGALVAYPSIMQSLRC